MLAQRPAPRGRRRVGNAERHDRGSGRARSRGEQRAGGAQQLLALALAGAEDDIGVAQLQRLNGGAGAQLALAFAPRGQRGELLLVGVVLVGDGHEAPQWREREQIGRQARGEDRVVARGLAQEPAAARGDDADTVPLTGAGALGGERDLVVHAQRLGELQRADLRSGEALAERARGVHEHAPRLAGAHVSSATALGCRAGAPRIERRTRAPDGCTLPAGPAAAIVVRAATMKNM